MKSVTMRVWATGALVCGVVMLGTAQQKAPDPKDPRIGLKAGLKDAGTAARNMELVSNLGRPEGFYDPKAPAGDAMPPERPEPAMMPSNRSAEAPAVAINTSGQVLTGVSGASATPAASARTRARPPVIRLAAPIRACRCQRPRPATASTRIALATAATRAGYIASSASRDCAAIAAAITTPTPIAAKAAPRR